MGGGEAGGNRRAAWMPPFAMLPNQTLCASQKSPPSVRPLTVAFAITFYDHIRTHVSQLQPGHNHSPAPHRKKHSHVSQCRNMH